MTDLINSPRDFLERNRLLWIRPAVIIAALVVSAFLAFFGKQSQLELLLVLMAGLSVAWIPVRWPWIGLFALVVAGVVSTYSGPGGINVTILIAAFLLAVRLARMIIVERKIALAPSRTLWPLVGLVVTALLSFIVGQFAWIKFANNAPLDAQLGGLAIYILSVGVFLLVANQVRNVRWLMVITWAVVVVGTLYMAGKISPNVLGVVTGSVIQTQVFGGIFYAWFPAILIGQALFNRDLRPAIRVILMIILVATLYSAFITRFDWKSGWMPAFAATIVVVFLRSWKLGLLLSLMALIPVLGLLPEFLASDAYSVSTRLDAWIIMGEIVKINPILGLGFANYYWYTPLFGIRGWNVAFNSHNNYIDIVAQTGLVGLAFVLWFFAEAAVLGFRLRSHVPDGFPKAYVMTAIGGIAGTLVAAMLGDWLLPFVYNIGLKGFQTSVYAWMFLGGLVVLENLYLSKNISSDEASESWQAQMSG